MNIYQWLKEVAWLTLKSAWHRSREQSKKRETARIFQNNDLTNPAHPFNMEQRAMEDDNDRRAQEALYDYLQDSQRFQDHHRHDY